MLEVISALGFGELVEDSTTEFPEFIDGSFRSVAEKLLQLRERQLDRIQIGRVGRQVAQLSTGGFDRFADAGDLVAGEIVHHDDVAGFQDGSQMLLDPGTEQRAVDRSLDGQRSDESFRTQRSKERGGLPATARSLFHQPRAQKRAAIAPRHIGFGPRFVDEHDFGGIDLLLRSTPLRSLLGHIRTILFLGNQRLFFRD